MRTNRQKRPERFCFRCVRAGRRTDWDARELGPITRVRGQGSADGRGRDRRSIAGQLTGNVMRCCVERQGFGRLGGGTRSNLDTKSLPSKLTSLSV